MAFHENRTMVCTVERNLALAQARRRGLIERELEFATGGERRSWLRALLPGRRNRTLEGAANHTVPGTRMRPAL